MSLHDVVRDFLDRSPGRWISRGYGRFACSSCGAFKEVDYGDQDTRMSEKREPCSKRCPWELLEQAAKEPQCSGHDYCQDNYCPVHGIDPDKESA